MYKYKESWNCRLPLRTFLSFEKPCCPKKQGLVTSTSKCLPMKSRASSYYTKDCCPFGPALDFGCEQMPSVSTDIGFDL